MEISRSEKIRECQGNPQNHGNLKKSERIAAIRIFLRTTFSAVIRLNQRAMKPRGSQNIYTASRLQYLSLLPNLLFCVI